ncbi:hemerythrin-like metal-binding protein [Solidesulfovibrio fructosivorans JJ]]|uniref:Hemerythrin-like metal-binding protein n=1 Tax=Solidesulfovibrio fructosivorans JJ] TaxID=596151 RepID=E1JVZ0_SOLFR|nr:bacteriohemerythrin [Solidesulfovibrio fructosivorans]EFL51350.1 hemerythrin-like metal-binding protein [Solidesulfovibrio fructosivorans JJ]]
MIAWDPALALGLQEVDAQHQNIIRLINELDANRGGGKTQLAAETLRFLHDYLNSHFVLETKLMRDVGYPDIERHRENHELFANHVIFFEIEKEFGVVTDQMLDDILAFLLEWFLHHITTEDRELANFVRTRAAAK